MKEFWIAKVFDNAQNTSKFYINTQDILEQEIPKKITTFNQTNLNKLINELAISKEEIENDNNKGPFSNLEKIRAIYNKSLIDKCWLEYKLTNDEKELLPTFRYLDWNCSLDEIKSTATDILKGIIEAQLNPVNIQLQAIKTTTELLINDKLTQVKNIVEEDFPNITGIKTNVFFSLQHQITDIIINKLNSDGDIHLDNQGEGVKRQIWFALLKAAAVIPDENEKIYTKYIWAFDEPETHLYPSAQRQLFEILKKVSLRNIQTILSTHSTVFIDKTKLKSIKSANLSKDGYTEICNCEETSDIFESLQIKNSDFLFYNKFLVIEGDTESYLIPKLFKLLGLGRINTKGF